MTRACRTGARRVRRSPALAFSGFPSGLSRSRLLIFRPDGSVIFPPVIVTVRFIANSRSLIAANPSGRQGTKVLAGDGVARLLHGRNTTVLVYFDFLGHGELLTLVSPPE